MPDAATGAALITPARALDPDAARDVLSDIGITADNRWTRAMSAAAGSAPYLGSLMRRREDTARMIASDGPDGVLENAMNAAKRAASQPFEEAMSTLRQAKADMHLACAIGDLACAWPLERVTGALSDFAMEATRGAIAIAAAQLRERGDLVPPPDDTAGPVPGFIVLAMGKLGAGELNYSSDVDLTLFVDPERVPVPPDGDGRRAALRLVPPFVRVMEEMTADGYVFRTDLRLRPDPASTPVVVSVNAAENYYQTVGQNWERAALIKARAIAGDIAAGDDFLKNIAPFIWRRHLDYAAIADIHSIKRQITAVHKGGDLDEAAPDVKVGQGGIREIELFAQTQQLILGGRDKTLRVQTTLGALDRLTELGVVDTVSRDELRTSYEFLRAVEHRIQMLDDEQTHRVPASSPGRERLAALCGYADFDAFNAALRARRQCVSEVDSQLFKQEESLADPLGSLVFTGVEDHPDTLRTLERLGFKDPSRIAAAVRGWHHGRMRATRSERAREILTAIMPKLLRAFGESGEPDAAFFRFDDFLKGLPAGVQVFSLLQAHPTLLVTIANAFGLAPRVASVLARRPALIDSLIDARFTQDLAEDEPGARYADLRRRIVGYSFEQALNEARRFHREEAMRIGLHLLQGRASARAAGEAYSDLAEAVVGALVEAALRETEQRFGPQPGAFSVIALGKFGGHELAEGSDLDVMLVYEAPESASANGLSPPEYYTRLTQRVISALSAPTEEGELYEIDMQLRPSGSKGPPAVRYSSFARYYEEEAWTWELQALTRLRAVAGDDALGVRVEQAAHAILTSARDRAKTLADVADMRARMDKERAGGGVWDLKLTPGGLVDVEFAVQALMLVNAAASPEIVNENTGDALAALETAGVLSQADAQMMRAAWSLYSDLTQILRICVEGAFEPDAASDRLRVLLARTGGEPDFAALTARLKDTQAAIRAAFIRLTAA